MSVEKLLTPGFIRDTRSISRIEIKRVRNGYLCSVEGTREMDEDGQSFGTFVFTNIGQLNEYLIELDEKFQKYGCSGSYRD